jgi:hypothetical protein
MRAGRALLVMVAVLCLMACSAAPTVDRITIVNATEYDLQVEVAASDRERWLPVAIVEARSEKVAQRILDQGDLWIFRFLHLGDPIGELSFTRPELEASDWRVEVPAQIAERLQRLGRAPSG